MCIGLHIKYRCYSVQSVPLLFCSECTAVILFRVYRCYSVQSVPLLFCSECTAVILFRVYRCYSCHSLGELKFFGQILEKSFIVTYLKKKPRPVGAEMFHAGERTDRDTHEENDSRFIHFCYRSYKRGWTFFYLHPHLLDKLCGLPFVFSQ